MTDYGPLDDLAVFNLYPGIQISHDNIEHYRALAKGRLVINKCHACGHWIYPHRPLCPECLSWDVRPTEVSGLGRVFMFTLLNQLRDPQSLIMEPMPVAAVELVEQKGLRYLSRIVNCPVEAITHDMPVQLTWLEPDEEGRRWPAFEPFSSEGRGGANG
jgi:uncharacterized OB-fold protein